MKEKKLVLRTCVATKEVCEKKDLFRIVRTPDSQVLVDLKGKSNGRGAYLKKSREAILMAQKTKILDRKLEVQVPEEIYEELLGYVGQ